MFSSHVPRHSTDRLSNSGKCQVAWVYASKGLLPLKDIRGNRLGQHRLVPLVSQFGGRFARSVGSNISVTHSGIYII